MSTKTLQYRIGMDIGELRRKGPEAGASVAAFNKELRELEKKQRAHRAALDDLGKGMLVFGLAVVAGLGLAAKAAIDWESAFTGVRKTVDGSDQEIAALEGELRQLARTLPASHKEIAAVAEAAGQLGIKRKDVADFTKTMVDLGETTNLTAEEAATSLAKFSNIMGTSASDVDRLGSALVALGNDGASTEKDILEMALRIAGAGKQINLTEGQVLGFASALSSVGVEAEAGGSSISRVMIDIASAVNAGGEQLEAFAKVAGLSGAEFTSTFRDDAAGAVVAFIQGLGRMQRSGEDVFGVLDELGLSEIRVRDALLRAASASDMFTKSLQVGSSAWAENSALTDEANKRYETSAAKLQVAGNQIKDTLIDIGAVVAPIAADAAQGASDIAKGFQELPGPLQDVVTWVGTAAGGIALFGGAAAIAAPRILDFRDKMRGLEATGGAVGKGLGKLGLFLSGPWGAAIGIGVGLLGLLAGAAGGAARREQELASAGKSVAQAIREQNGVINESVIRTAAKAAQESGLLGTSKRLGIEMGTVTNAILGQGNAYNELKTRLQGIIAANTERTNTTRGIVTRMNDEAIAAQHLMRGIDDLVGGKNAELQATKDTDQAAQEATATQKEHAKSAQQLAKETEDAAKALDVLVAALNAMNDTTLNFREAQRAYIEQIEETNAVLKKNGTGLDENTEKGRENARALDARAKSANDMAEAAAREAEKTGGSAAGAAALTASLMASRPGLVEQAKAFGMAATEAEKYADSVLGIPQPDPTVFKVNLDEVLGELKRVQDAIKGVPPDKKVNVGVLSQEAIKKLQEIGYKVETLPNGDVVVYGNTNPAQQQLNNFIASNAGRTLTISARVAINTAAVAKEIRYIQGLGNAYGNIVSFARGGFHENHTPQIAKARPGMVRVWAEPDTDRESYIPWAMDRRPRAEQILATTAAGFGYGLVPKSHLVSRFSDGGVAGGVTHQMAGGGTLVFHANIVGSRTEWMNWVTGIVDDLKRRGRI